MSIVISDIIDTIIHADCLDVLSQLPSKSVALILADPPYGIGEAAGKNKSRGCIAKARDYGNLSWDNSPPPADFFAAIKRVGQNQIVWGGNYFAEHLGNSPCWLVWDKDNGATDFADCELAWTSFPSAVRRLVWRWQGMLQQQMGALKELRYHPTQKPVPLYKWCISKYTKPGDIVLDPMCGSGTAALACHALGRHFICIERELEYVNVARNRLDELRAQGDLFTGSNSESYGAPQTATNSPSMPNAQLSMEL